MTIIQSKEGIVMRISKSPEVRKKEILDVSECLFTTRGYSNVTISDIVDEMGVAKGTVYYYFKSKEDLLDAVVFRSVDRIVNKAKLVVENSDLNAIDKLVQITDLNALAGDEKTKHSYALPLDNGEMKIRLLIRSISAFSPLLTQIIEQGIREQSMSTKYPAEVAEILIAAEKVLFEGLFKYEYESFSKKIIAFVDVIEIVLGIEKGKLAPLIELFNNIAVLF